VGVACWYLFGVVIEDVRGHGGEEIRKSGGRVVLKSLERRKCG
jgi:hypothetical protein